MRRTSLIIILVFVAGFGAGYFAQTAVGSFQRRGHAADLAAIEKLHQEEIEATIVQDPQRLVNLWDENAVAFYPGSPPAIGRDAIRAHNDRFHEQNPHLKVLSYTSKYKNLQLENGLACEWFDKEAKYKLSPESALINWRTKGILVLKRQHDGSWRGVMVFPE
jgi:ketosteroid isomerase-like protein